MADSAADAARYASIATLSGVAAATVCSLFASTGSTSAHVRSGSLSQAATSSVQIASRIRAPSATMSLVLIGQIQFLATLSLVDSTGAEDSWILDFAKHLRWVNLWPPGDVVESYTPVRRTVRLDDTDGLPRCDLADAGSDEIGALVFIGNLVLFAFILLALFVLHIVLASGVEAYWLTKERAKEEVKLAQTHGTPISEVTIARWSKWGVRSNGDSDPTAGTTFLGSHRPRQQLSQGGSALRDRDGYEENASDDEEKGNQDVVRSGDAVHSGSHKNMVLEYRDRSTSAWLHFPHVELVFLLFAFEGVIAAGASALRESRCPWVIIVAMISLLLYPTLMFVMVCRTIAFRVRSDALIAFEPTIYPDKPEDGGDDENGFFSRVITSCKESRSLISWADAGQWVTVETVSIKSRPGDGWVQTSVDENARREGDRFRIGFEPLFVDFTKAGSWFMAYSLVQSAVFASVGVLIDESVQQLSLFCAQLVVTCVVLARFKPFANRFVNSLAACLSGADAVCMAVLAVAAYYWKGTDRAERADNAVIIVQLMVLVVLILPMYIDLSSFVIGAVSKLMRKKVVSETVDDNAKEKRSFVRRYVFRAWGATWCSTVRRNMFACVKDTSEGVRRPRMSTDTPVAPRSRSAGRMVAAPTWPALESPPNTGMRPAEIGTTTTPLVGAVA